ncbi:MAG TPA: nicotinate phosphoribosyltransferase [Acidimicrobiales bacterium]|nr:nicotinate phosphoribosyltransferase [Acidimicrobiales bacterium]
MASPLLTDLYGLNMAASYWRQGMTGEATFSLYVRELPPSRGFLVAAGLDDCLDHLEHVHFTPDDLGYLATIGFDAGALEAFAAVRFTGEVRAVPEGRLVFANEPLLEVTAPIAEAQLVESFLLNQVTMQTTLATKAARCVMAAAGQIDLVEFGFRRAQGIDAGMAVARLAVMVGFSGTSNVEAARRFGLEPVGTMAHSYIEAFPSELAAFRSFAQDRPGQSTFLVDTYDTVAGVKHAIEAVRSLGLEHRAAIRIDSGDLVALARQARDLLDGAGLPDVRILVSGGLDEFALEELVASGAPIDAAGVGTRMATAADAPYVDSAYKLVAYDGRGVVKLSEDKETLPGAKQVYRRPGLCDTLCLRDERPPTPEAEALMVVVMEGGRRTGERDPLTVARARFERDRAALADEQAHLERPVHAQPEISSALRALERTARHAAGAQVDAGDGAGG